MHKEYVYITNDVEYEGEYEIRKRELRIMFSLQLVFVHSIQ